MSPLPLSTTTVTVQARSEPSDETDAPTFGAASTAVAAHVSDSTGLERVGGEGVERVDKRLYIPTATTVAQGDRVTDTGTGITYRVAWTTERQGLGLGHTVAGLVALQGRSAA